MLFLTLLGCAHHIAPTTATAAPLPPLPAEHAASGLSVCRADFQAGTLPHGMVIARGHVKDDVPSLASGLVLEHPIGDYLLDGGISAEVTAHLAAVHGFVGFAMRQSSKGWVTKATPAEALRALNVDPATLLGLIPSHGHYDHLGGLLDLPGPPVLLPAAEIAEAQRSADGESSGILPDEARALLPRARPMVFDGPAVGSWPASLDLYGDGSVLILPSPGHTPGSIATYIRLPSGKRLLHVGDTVWVREGYELREPKSWIAASFDSDAAATDVQIQHLWALHRADPELLILPAHDSRQWDLAFAGEPCLR